MTDEDFNPDDIRELEETYKNIVFDNENGFTIEFGISLGGAKELVELHSKATDHDLPDRERISAKAMSWAEYTKIINHLKQALADGPAHN